MRAFVMSSLGMRGARGAGERRNTRTQSTFAVAPRVAAVLVATSLVGCTGGYGARAVTPQGPKTQRYDSSRPIPPDYHLETKDRTGLAVGGAVLLGVGYAAAAGLAVSCESGCERISATRAGTRVLFVPVVGPLIATFEAAGRPYRGAGAGPGNILPLLLAADFSVQAGGVALMILGLTLKPKQVLVRDDVAPLNVRLVPLRVGEATGLGLVSDW